LVHGWYAPVQMPDASLRKMETSWNRSAALRFVGGDESLLNEMVAMFLVDSPKLLGRLEQALLQRDDRNVELAAHSLRGQLQYLGARDVAEAAEKLEAAGRSGNIDGREESLDELRRRLAILWAALSHIADA
jgi:HPt (histidine-containing phosphotransfer) domain-containing protein